MALKALFPRKPLMELNHALLPYGALNMTGELYQTACQMANTLAKEPLTPTVLEALIPAACLMKDKTLMDKCHAALLQHPFMDENTNMADVDMLDAIKISKALMAYYEARPDKALLLPMMRLNKHMLETWDAMKTNVTVLVSAGDIIEITIWLYNITGKKPLLTLIDRLRQNTLDWTSAFHTFDIVKPAVRMMDMVQVKAGMEAEHGDIGGLYTRQYYMADGLSVAKNLKTPALFAMVSGSSKEKDAPMVGYKKLLRYHGVAGGIFTADPFLDGQNPKHGTDVRVIGELAYSLSVVAQLDNDAYDALESVVLNALLASVKDDRVQLMHYVNEQGEAFVEAKDALLHYAALLKGLCAYLRNVGAILKDGALQINFLTPCSMRVRTEQGIAKVDMLGAVSENETNTMKVNYDGSDEFALAIRVPAWAHDAFARQGEALGTQAAGDRFIKMKLQAADTEIAVNLYRNTIEHKGFRQSQYVTFGATVLAGGEAEKGAMVKKVTINNKDMQLAPYRMVTKRVAQFFSEETR